MPGAVFGADEGDDPGGADAGGADACPDVCPASASTAMAAR
jgi:hypothetical protein